MQLRGPRKSDVDYIMDTWLGRIRGAQRDLPDDLFFPAYRALIKRVIASSQVLVLADGDYIFGYSVAWEQEGVLHWLYMRKQSEEQAKLLLSRLPERPVHTFRIQQSQELLGRRQEYLLRRLKEPLPDRKPEPSSP